MCNKRFFIKSFSTKTFSEIRMVGRGRGGGGGGKAKVGFVKPTDAPFIQQLKAQYGYKVRSESILRKYMNKCNMAIVFAVETLTSLTNKA